MIIINIPSNILDQVEDIRDLDISYDTLHEKAIVSNKQTDTIIKVPYMSITNKYRNLLAKIVVEGTLSEEEKKEFWYKPKTLSDRLYGTTELWSELLLLNNCATIIQFTPTKVRYYDPYEFKTYLNEIMTIERMV